jgi:hypothetical protein
MTRAKHRFQREVFVGAKPPGNFDRCVKCGAMRLVVQALDPITGADLGQRFDLFRGVREGGWSTARPLCESSQFTSPAPVTP